MEESEGRPIEEIYIATKTGGVKTHSVSEIEGRETEAGKGPSWLKVDPSKINDKELRKLVTAYGKTTVSMLDSEELRRMHHKIALLEEAPDNEMNDVLTAIEDYFDAHFTSEEYMTERIPTPETTEDWVRTTIEHTFALIDQGITEEKNFEEMFDEYQAIRRLIKRDCPEKEGLSLDQMGDGEEIKERNRKLSGYLKSECPEGIYLKERLELFLEAARRLHKRHREVVKADGSLAGLKVIKVSEGFSAEIVTQLTELRPIDWYVLTHLDDLFPEGGTDRELRIEIERAWSVWQDVGSHPYEENPKYNPNSKKKEEKDEWIPKKIKINGRELGDSTLVDYYRDESVVRKVRDEIGELVGRRAEQLVHMFLTVGLTYDMWDRERWKVQTVGEARDLMNFDRKRIGRLKNERTGEGPEWTVGLFWAEEEQDSGFTLGGLNFEDEEDEKGIRKANPKLWKVIRGVRERLKGNKKRALFLNSKKYPTIGGLAGDYWHTAFHEVDNEVQRETATKEKPDKRRKLYGEYGCPRDIPWLVLNSIEAKSYASYFGYSLAVAKGLRDLIMETEYKPEEQLMEVKFWRTVNDMTHRLNDYCPWMLGRNYDSHRNWMDNAMRERVRWQMTMKMRRLIAEGILFTGSYLASSKPGLILARGKWSREQVWGRKIFLVAGVHGGIMGAIEASGGLDDANYAEFERVVGEEFNFETKGRIETRRR